MISNNTLIIWVITWIIMYFIFFICLMFGVHIFIKTGSKLDKKYGIDSTPLDVLILSKRPIITFISIGPVPWIYILGYVIWKYAIKNISKSMNKVMSKLINKLINYLSEV